MTLAYDLRTFQVLFPAPMDTGSRDRRVVTIAEAIRMIEKERQRKNPKWRQYYQKHHEKELARQRDYRATHREQVREYNQQYYRSRKEQKAAGRAAGSGEVAICST